MFFFFHIPFSPQFSGHGTQPLLDKHSYFPFLFRIFSPFKIFSPTPSGFTVLPLKALQLV